MNIEIDVTESHGEIFERETKLHKKKLSTWKYEDEKETREDFLLRDILFVFASSVSLISSLDFIYSKNFT